MKNYFRALRNYTKFSGRSGRGEYWTFTLVNLLTLTFLSYINSVIDFNNQIYGYFALQSTYALIISIPWMAVFVRRMHDISKSGRWIFLLFLPIIGWIWLFIMLDKKGKVGQNSYESDPRKNKLIMMY
jgi:uncharacterized membrane protein YhaH (DUF805 family)